MYRGARIVMTVASLPLGDEIYTSQSCVDVDGGEGRVVVKLCHPQVSACPACRLGRLRRDHS